MGLVGSIGAPVTAAATGLPREAPRPAYVKMKERARRAGAQEGAGS
jgi:hypothetical protein